MKNIRELKIEAEKRNEIICTKETSKDFISNYLEMTVIDLISSKKETQTIFINSIRKELSQDETLDFIRSELDYEEINYKILSKDHIVIVNPEKEISEDVIAGIIKKEKLRLTWFPFIIILIFLGSISMVVLVLSIVSTCLTILF